MQKNRVMLVADDIDVNRASFRAMFEEEYEVLEAGNGDTKNFRRAESGYCHTGYVYARKEREAGIKADEGRSEASRYPGHREDGHR